MTRTIRKRATALEYKVEAFISKIKSPVICVTEDGEMEYANGSELYAHPFDRHYIVDSMEVRDEKVVLYMKENRPAPPMNWIGEDWVQDYERDFGTEPSFF